MYIYPLTREVQGQGGLNAKASHLSRMLTYAHVCSRMLTYAHVCSRMQGGLNAKARQQQLNAAMRIERVFRGHLSRKEYRVMLESVEDARAEELAAAARLEQAALTKPTTTKQHYYLNLLAILSKPTY